MKDKKYPTTTSILGKLVSMIVAKHGNVQGPKETSRLFMLIRRFGLRPDMDDDQIEAELSRMLEAGRFDPPEGEGEQEEAVASQVIADAGWLSNVSSELERVGAVYDQHWELSGETITIRSLTFDPTDEEGVMTVMHRKRRESLFRIKLEDVLPALRAMPDGLGTHGVISELRKHAVE
ncbi:MAG: hypothetical protein ACYTGB_14540 [Planctomycetota bacterium]|jgi:hypothetical protein